MAYRCADLESLWTKIKYAFPILQEPFVPVDTECTLEEFSSILNEMQLMKFENQIADLVFYTLEKHCGQYVVPKFWFRFKPCEDEMEGFTQFKTAIHELYTGLTEFSNMFERMQLLYNVCENKRSLNGEKTVLEYVKLMVRATLLSQIPYKFEINVDLFYKTAFNVFLYPENDSMHSDDMLKCYGCGLEAEMECRCQQIISVFHATNKMLIDLNLLERLAGQVLTNLIQERIQDHIYKSYKRSFDVSHLKDSEAWLETTVMSWLIRIYCEGNAEPSAADTHKLHAINRFKKKLSYYLYETYTVFMIDQLFTIIIDFPDSTPALDDIKICLEKTELRSFLCERLIGAYETRLLHPGVNTSDILTAYIAAIRALKYIDSTGVLLETVTQPVKNYLRTRDDTVRCVVSSLTDDGTSDLSEELSKFNSENPDESDCEIDAEWEKWHPDPIEADPSVPSKTRRSNDIISILVNVYGSKELFVNEYRTLLADRLLTQGVFNAEKEIRHLELLKLRFGESQLHFCEVMLKDISDSKRINSLIQQDPIYENVCKKFPSNALILSAQFWPPFKDEILELPPEIKEQLELYTKGFEALKGNRTLSWKPHLGNVNIEVEVADKKMNLSVTPMQATIIIHFQEKSEWNIEDLSGVMKVPATVLRKKIAYWQSMGLIAESSRDTFTLMENATNQDRSRHRANVEHGQEMICEDEESESVMTSAQEQRAGELQVFWSYIVGMLTNLDALPLDRIHQMLKMFAAQASGTECSLQELRLFLDAKLRNHELVLQGGMYRLPKS